MSNLINFRSVGDELYHTDRLTDEQTDGQKNRQTDRHDEANSCFSQIWERH
jgi:hypothetical protein